MPKTRRKTREAKKPSTKKPLSSVERTYRNIFFGFAAITVLVVLFVLYFSLSKTTITITPKDVPVSTTFHVSVRTGPNESDVLPTLRGEFLEKTLTRTEAYTDLTSTEKREVKATGKVTIINNYSKAQPLAPTTRLLSNTSNVLFRTQDLVTVPAGGSVTVDVEADQPGEAGGIGPEKFTIVALWPGLQSQIYGESSEPMSLGVKDVMIATEDDILAAKVKNREAISEEAFAALEAQAIEEARAYPVSEKAINRVILSEDVDVKPDAETDSIPVTTEARFTAVLFDPVELAEVARSHLEEKIEDHVELETFTPDMVSFELVNIDVAGGVAELKVTADATTHLKLSHPVFARVQFTGRDAQDIRTYLLDFEEIEKVDVEFFPFWVTNAPSLVDHIEINIIE
ncbi:MAG: hypothetical protein HYV34_00970 [Candidatus Kerfeldbacteria bacterium]|nr:hypothetical protein [Candidatus Kerfeldbacteria bacterium]